MQKKKLKVTFYNNGDSPLRFSWQISTQTDVLGENVQDSEWFEESLEAKGSELRIL